MSAQGEPVLMHPPKPRQDVTGRGTPIEPDPKQTFDLSCEEFLVRLAQTDKGIKLDFKSPYIVVDCLELLAKIKPKQPVMFNADLVPVTGGADPEFHPDFVELCRRLHPDASLSLAWKTNPDQPITADDVDHLLAVAGSEPQIVFPVRACLAQAAWPQLQRLVADRSDRCLYFWNNEVMSPQLLDWIASNTDPSVTLYDLVDESGQPLVLPRLQTSDA